MTSSVKSGFTTINRLLGKKSKDEIPVDPHSSTGSHSSGSPTSIFSKSMSNLDTSSQYNKIVPLAAMNNAPFEQTFRITVALPRDQLYVVRVGAKMKLQQILEMTCTAKQLDPDKYEFRHPADNSTVFSNGCTIGEVGLNEIRLVPISERRQPTFSSADLGRMQAGNRNSYAAPSSNTTITMNGTSPPVRNGTSNRSQYSSTNSLNSFESVANMQRAPGQPVPPMRKKRAAPRPPSQYVIPEDSPPIRQMSFHVSSPNLSQNLQIMSVAGNKEATPRKQNGGMRPVSMFPETPLQSAYNGSAADLVSPTRGLSRSTSNASDMAPGAAPRRKKAAPAPPPRVRDSITPQPAPRSKTPVPQELLEKKVSEASENVSKTLLNAPDVIAVSDVFAKVVSREQPKDIMVEKDEEEVLGEKCLKEPPSVVAKGLRSPVPLAIDTRKEKVDTVPTPSPTAFREQEMRMNSYNLNTGKCVEADVVPNLEEDTEDTVEEEPEMSSQAIEDMILQQITDSCQETVQRPHVVEDLYAEVKKAPKKEVIESPEVKTNGTKDQEQRSASPMWTYTLPAPMHFADGNNNNLLMVANGGGGTVDNLSPTLTDHTAEPTETFNGNVYYNYSVNDDSESIAARSMTTTVVSDVIITPVIKERIPMLDQPLMLPLDDDDDDHFNNISESSDFNSSSTLTSASPNNIHGEDEDTAEERRKKLIINSDIEDGYHGPDERMFVNQGLIDTLEKRREKFIESELAQLVAKEETSPSPENNHPELMYEEKNEEETKTDKASTLVSDENQEPTISRSPIEDGLPSARDFIRQKLCMEDSGKDSDMFNSSEGSKNDSLETTTSSQDNSVAHHQSFEQRRSSYLAELENSKNLFNRKSSNELSISDVPPSLQSLQVMRSIMMTAAAAKKVEQEESVVDKTVDDKVVHTFDRVENILKVEEEVKRPVVQEAKKEDPPKPVVVETKPWKYTGPPKINLGSWSERPKIQVCLKTDRDYHHSRQKAAAEEAAKESEQKPTFEVSSKEKSPIVLRSVELRKTISVPEDKSPVIEPSAAPQPQPIPTETVMATVKARIQRPVSMHSTRFTPTVRGFVSKGNEDSDIRSTMINPVLMRSDSNVAAMANGGITIRREEEEFKVAKELAPAQKSPPVVVAEKATLFSQSTLRRTGLKDRIMSSPSVEEPSFSKEVSKPVEVPQTKVPLKSILVDKSAVQCAASVVVSSPVSPPPPPPPMPIKSSPGSLLNPLARLSIPPPPPVAPIANDQKVAAKPIVRGMVAKRPPITPEVDPREQLLDSIRNFSFSSSRKV